VAFGTPGGDPQDQWSLVFFLAHVYFGLNLQEVIDAPMFHTNHFPSSFYPRAAAPGQVAAEGTGYHVSTGVAPDLMEATKRAVRATMEHLGERHGLSREEAYALCSVAVDLRIHEVVDAPNWVVGAFLPDDIFTGGGNR
jgi:acetamidase/formamidase